MTNIKFNLNNLDIIKILFIFFLILIFTIPIIIYGIMDLEDYKHGFFSSYLISINYLNPFIFFSDAVGPGINFPTGNGVHLNPLLLFASNAKLFYFLITFFHLSLQSFYFIKINKLFNVKNYVIFFVPLIIFSNTNLNYHYSDDWITASSNFTFVFVVSYYFLKILKRNFHADYIKFSIFFFLFFENGHIRFIFFYCIFLILLFIFSENKMKIIKSYKLYTFLIVLILLLLEKLYYYGDIFLALKPYNDVINMGFTSGNPGFNEFFKSFYPFNGSFKAINRLSSNPYLIVLAFLFIFLLREEKKFVNLKYIFLIILICNFTVFLTIFDFILSSAWWTRDFTLILSSLICLQYFHQIKKVFRNFIIIFLFTYSMLYFGKNISGNMLNTNNFILNKPTNLIMINFFDNLNIENNFNRVYLGPDAFKFLDGNNSAEYGIYDSKDLTKFNLFPFNSTFKNVKNTILFKQRNQDYYYSETTPQIDHLKNLFFLSIFNIDYSFISKNELNLLNDNYFEIVDILNLHDRDFYFIKNKIDLLGIINPEELIRKINKCKYLIMECLNNEKKLFTKIDGNFIKEKNSLYKINLNNNFDLYPVLPFVFDKNWTCNNKKCLSIGNFLTYSSNNSEIVEIKYHDKIRFILRVFSLSIFVSLFLLLIFKCNKLKI